jgi:hypothetical protein
LTTRFRVVQTVGRVLLASGVSTAANPVVNHDAVSDRPAALVALEWQTDTEPLQGKTGEYANYVRMNLRLHGSESALMAALAGFESLERPLGVVVGSKLERLDRQPAGARPDLRGGAFYAAPALLTLELVIFDYTDMPDPRAGIAAPQVPRSAAMPGMPGMPAGMGMPPMGPGGMPAGMAPSMAPGIPPGMSPGMGPGAKPPTGPPGGAPRPAPAGGGKKSADGEDP